MMRHNVKIGNKTIDHDNYCYIIAEIGINHNGSINLAKQLIDMAVLVGCDAVKFQKRTIDVVYTKEELDLPRPTPLGETNGDLKRGLEFGFNAYKEIDSYCKAKKIDWFASCWDEQSVDFIDQFDVVAYKIPSASLTDDNLLKHTKSKGKPVIISCGMSTLEQIDHAMKILGEENTVLLHSTSTYPTENNEINLRVIENLRKKYNCPIGYSGHEKGIMPSIMAVMLGAACVERHITIDRTLWGSDHAASLEFDGLRRLVRDIRQLPKVLGDGKKVVYDSELPVMKKLRRV